MGFDFGGPAAAASARPAGIMALTDRPFNSGAGAAGGA
tara:strand:+ start:234 stop:347 length:114 start_codon:yes stop_codon:yes gene_type:complete